MPPRGLFGSSRSSLHLHCPDQIETHRKEIEMHRLRGEGVLYGCLTSRADCYVCGIENEARGYFLGSGSGQTAYAASARTQPIYMHVLISRGELNGGR